MSGFRQRVSVDAESRAHAAALKEQVALACVVGERCSALELLTGLLEAAELCEEVAADARQEVVSLERRL